MELQYTAKSYRLLRIAKYFSFDQKNAVKEMRERRNVMHCI